MIQRLNHPCAAWHRAPRVNRHFRLMFAVVLTATVGLYGGLCALVWYWHLILAALGWGS